MDYAKAFAGALQALKDEGRYRVFADIRRDRGRFPAARHYRGGTSRPITVWCSNDYLGMGQHPAVVAAMHAAIDAAGAGSGGTRNISGTTHYHVELEAELADLHAKEAALLFTSAYVANDTTLTTLRKLLPGLVIFSDAKNHASMIAGIRNGGGEKVIWRNNDLADLDAKLKAVDRDRPKVIAFESCYSMDGQMAPIGAICDLAHLRRAHLPRRGACGRPLLPPRRRPRGAPGRHAPRRHRQRYAGQGLWRHGRLHCRHARPVRRDPLLCAGLHFHHLARPGDRGRRHRQHQASEGEQHRA
jgi:7-keto-8-aminopelargonate synthetase-like enzyme